MARRKRKPQLPPSGDTGPDTAAQRDGAEYRVDRATGACRKFKLHILERMTRLNKPLISRRQCAGGFALLERYERTMESSPPPWSRDYVDSSPLPGDVNIEKLLAEASFKKIEDIVPRESRRVVFLVVCLGLAIGAITSSMQEARMLIGLLRDGLDAVATELSI